MYLSNPRGAALLIGLTKSHDEEILRHGAIAVSSLEFGSGNSPDVDFESGLTILVQFGSTKNERMQIQVCHFTASTREQCLRLS